MNTKILGINTNFAFADSPNFHQEPFQNCSAFVDYDAVLINTHNLALQYDSVMKKDEYAILTNEATNQMKADFTHIRKQIKDMLEQGKCVFVMQGDVPERYFYTGERQILKEAPLDHSKTNKKKRAAEPNCGKQIAMVASFKPLSFLPIKHPQTYAKGSNFGVCTNPIYAEFFNNTNKYCYYTAYAELPDAHSLVRIAQTNLTVASVFESGNGKIIFLPSLKPTENYATQAEWQKSNEYYIEQLLYLVQSLSEPITSYALPAWTSEIYLRSECATLNKLASKTAQLQRLENSVHKLKIRVNELQSYKQLLTAEGSSLVRIVAKTFKELGLKTDSKTQIASVINAKYRTRRIIADVIASRKCAVNSHVTALERLTANNIPRNGISPKPILVINAYCNVPLDTRPTMIFPHNLVRYATARNHCLLPTTQLLCLYLEIRNNPNMKDTLLKELVETVGVYSRYADPYKILTQIK